VLFTNRGNKSISKPRSHWPGVRPSASQQFVAGGPERTGTNREGIRVRLNYSRSATDHTRFGAKSDHVLSRLCYGLRWYIPGVVPEALRWVSVRPVRPDIGDRAPTLAGFSTATHGGRAAKPRCYTVAYDYQWNFRGTYNRYVICKVQNSSYIPR